MTEIKFLGRQKGLTLTITAFEVGTSRWYRNVYVITITKHATISPVQLPLLLHQYT